MLCVCCVLMLWMLFLKGQAWLARGASALCKDEHFITPDAAHQLQLAFTSPVTFPSLSPSTQHATLNTQVFINQARAWYRQGPSLASSSSFVSPSHRASSFLSSLQLSQQSFHPTHHFVRVPPQPPRLLLSF